MKYKSVVATGLLFVVTIIAGDLRSLAQPGSAMSIVHKAGSFLTLASGIVAMFLLENPLK